LCSDAIRAYTKASNAGAKGTHNDDNETPILSQDLLNRFHEGVLGINPDDQPRWG
jgi:hypothetical protein